MDLGVGSFVFASGMVSALPRLRSRSLPPLGSGISKAFLSSLKVLGLGVIRLLMVKSADYPVRNFFSDFGIMRLTAVVRNT
jgi:glucosaminylphosphatidylinositol acyltransferase